MAGGRRDDGHGKSRDYPGEDGAAMEHARTFAP
jgi:hypothetical protein